MRTLYLGALMAATMLSPAAANAAEANNTKDLISELGPHVLFTIPFPCLEAVEGRRNISRKSQQ